MIEYRPQIVTYPLTSPGKGGRQCDGTNKDKKDDEYLLEHVVIMIYLDDKENINKK